MAETTLLRLVDIHSPDPKIIAEAAACLVKGGLVAFPTETVYGLGANALDPEAVRRIFEAKQRPTSDPLIVHVASEEDILLIAADVPPLARTLMHAFWPGPLTLLLPRHPDLPEEVTAGRTKVAVRMPAHPVARALIEAAGVPVAAPSANRFAHTSPTLASHVLDDLEGRIEMVLDAGPATMGVESTVLDPSSSPPVILRLGSLPREQIESLIGSTRVAGPEEDASSSPGRLPRHYAPDARLILSPLLDPTKILQQFIDQTSALHAAGHTVGWMAVDEVIALVDTRRIKNKIWNLGSLRDSHAIARRLFVGIRALEADGMDCILAHLLPPQGLGAAINDRLTRASFHTED